MDVLKHLDAKRKVMVVQTAPAVRVAIGEEMGMDEGAIATGQMVEGLRRLGFDYVFDTNFSAVRSSSRRRFLSCQLAGCAPEPRPWWV